VPYLVIQRGTPDLEGAAVLDGLVALAVKTPEVSAKSGLLEGCFLSVDRGAVSGAVAGAGGEAGRL